MKKIVDQDCSKILIPLSGQSEKLIICLTTFNVSLSIGQQWNIEKRNDFLMSILPQF